MAAEKKPGRPQKSDKERVKTKYIYISDSQELKIKKGFKTLTKAILAKCG